jgi:hypothetical protein
MRQKINGEKGISILLAVLILSLVLTVALGTSTVLIGQVRSIKDVSKSVVAFYAADAGIEELLLSDPPVDISGAVGAATYDVSVVDNTDPDCNAPNYCVKSIGSYLGTKRALEIQF